MLSNFVHPYLDRLLVGITQSEQAGIEYAVKTLADKYKVDQKIILAAALLIYPQCDKNINILSEHIEQMMPTIRACESTDAMPAYLSCIDGRFITLSGYNKIYDVQTEEFSEEMPPYNGMLIQTIDMAKMR